MGIFLAVIALATSQPSFDCAKASTLVEKMICTDGELAALDRAVAKLYAGVPRGARGDRLTLFKQQPDWLKDRDKCTDRDCLIGAYDERLFDLFTASRTPTSDYSNKSNNGSLSILYVGDGWYAFHVQGLWIGSMPGAVNDTEEYGHFRLRNGKAQEAPGEDFCGWRIERLPRDRWAFEEILPNSRDMIGCGGLNATATGIYSR